MIKTSVVRKVSVDDVRGISHLVAIGMMTTDVFDENAKSSYLERYDFVNLINNYIMHCDPQTKSIEYCTKGEPHKRVIIRPAGLDGIRIEYYLSVEKRVTTWPFDTYAELANDDTRLENDLGSDDDDDEEWYK